MSATLLEGSGRATTPDAPTPSRPRAWVVRTLLVVGITALVAGALVTARDLGEPKARGLRIATADTAWDRVDYVDAEAVTLVTYRHGEDIAYAFTIDNDAAFPVTIEDVPLPSFESRPLIQPAAVTVDGAPFAPFALAPGESREVVIRGVFYNCAYYTERAMGVIDSQPVTWSVAGLSRTVEVPLSEQLAVKSPIIRDCPGRVMDRSARRIGDG